MQSWPSLSVGEMCVWWTVGAQSQTKSIEASPWFLGLHTLSPHCLAYTQSTGPLSSVLLLLGTSM